MAAQARRTLAEALARGETRHVACKRNQRAIEEIRELYRRSGGSARRLGMMELADLYEASLGDVRSMREYRALPLRLEFHGWVDETERERLLALPEYVEIRDKVVGIDYDVEFETGGDTVGAQARALGVARLVMPEKLARSLVEEELPTLDRPLRFVVHRGQRGSVRAATLGELQERLDMPWAPDERSGGGGGGSGERGQGRRERDVARVRGEFGRAERGGRGGRGGRADGRGDGRGADGRGDGRGGDRRGQGKRRRRD